MLRSVSVADEQLRGNASPVRTGASEGPAFDERNVHAGRAAVDGGRNRIAAAKDDEIVMFGTHANDSSQWHQFLTSQSGGDRVCPAAGRRQRIRLHRGGGGHRIFEEVPFGWVITMLMAGGSLSPWL
jgi:hypothetical protein